MIYLTTCKAEVIFMKSIQFSLKYFKFILINCIFLSCIANANVNNEITNKSQSYLRHWLYSIEPEICDNQCVKENKSKFMSVIENDIKKLKKKSFDHSLNYGLLCLLFFNSTVSSLNDIINPRYKYYYSKVDYFLNRSGVFLGSINIGLFIVLWKYDQIDIEKKLERDYRILSILKTIA